MHLEICKFCTIAITNLYNWPNYKNPVYAELQASYPGLLAPAFVTCSTNTGEGLVKLSRGMTYLDMWRSGTFLLYSCKAAFWIQERSTRLSDVECSVVLRSVFAIGSALAYLLFFQEGATPPHVQVRHTTWLSFTRPSPVLVLQVTNAGARMPGYEAKLPVHLALPQPLPHQGTWA